MAIVVIVYVFFKDFLKKIYLPNKVFGVYPFHLNQNQVLFNIDGKGGVWHLRVSGKSVIYVNKNQQENPELKSNNTYVINSPYGNYYIYALPSYSDSLQLYRCNKKKISVGKSNNNDIVYDNPYMSDEEYKIIIEDNNKWTLSSSTKNVYINDKMTTNKNLLTGDNIFCFGLRIVPLGDTLLIYLPEKAKINNNTLVRVDLPPMTDTKGTYALLEDTPLYDKKSFFTKSPRFRTEIDDKSVVIDPVPTEEKPEDIPIILTLGPQVTMILVSVVSASSTIADYFEGKSDVSGIITTLITLAATILTALLWPLLAKAYNTRRVTHRNKRKMSLYRDYLKKKSIEINELKDKIKIGMSNSYPSLTDCSEIIKNHKTTLWNKNIDDDDFLKISLGTGTVDSEITVDYPEKHFSTDSLDKITALTEEVVNGAKYMEDVPYPLSLTENNVTAIIGEQEIANRLLDNMFLQIMTSHSYADLKIIVYLTEDSINRWEYLKILPHCWNNQHNIRYFATNIEEFNTAVAEIESQFDSRKDSKEKSDDDDGSEVTEVYKTKKPYYLIFTNDIDTIRNASLVKKVLNYKKNLGFSLLIECERLNMLPDQTSTFIYANKETAALFTNSINSEDKTNFSIDFTTPINMYESSKILANTPMQIEKGKYELPKSLSFLEMFNVGRVEQLNCLERWKTNNPVNSLSVPVGIDQNGEIFKMDIHEKSYGPHGLIAGTTGSGKSEWIITFILSLATNFNPDEVQFVLIDYKGGGLAMSFENKDLGVKLPHLAGTITNLDKSAINRSISAIESELKRRQSIFNDAREKLKEGQMDIYKYQQYYRKGLVDKPLSHLLIICDEFAELKQQQPEFMEQLISTSRIGRSLGVHLILATQKPSGVVNDQIWSNSRFKVCLRVQDRSDSNEILKKPDAAFLKQVGAFYLEVGNDEYYNLGQSAWAGAKYYPSDEITHTVDQSVQNIDNIGKVINYYDEEQKNKPQQNEGEELLNIVKYIDGLTKIEHFHQEQLWLPNIKEDIYLSEIKKEFNYQANHLNYETVIGEYDEPRKQEQNLLTIDLMKGNIAIVGQPGSGKELLLSTIFFSSIFNHSPSEINYYFLDFGAETLRKFSKFPHVGEVVFRDDMERVGGVIQLIMDEISKRKELFQEYNGSLEYYNSHSEKKLPLICFVINGYDVFGETLPRIVDSFSSLFRDAPRCGVTFILSASAQNTFRTSVLQYFNRLIVMNLQDETQYRNLTNCRKGLIPRNIYGRGICKINDDDDSYCEFQTARITEPEKELEYLRYVAKYLSENYKETAKKVMTIPNNITSEDLIKYITTMADLPIGYNFYEKDIAKLDLSKTKLYPIVTKDMKNSINFIYSLANLLSKVPNTVVRVVDFLGIFEKPILDIKLFSDNLTVVTAAIEGDVEKRNETQPLAINIILGVGTMNSKLDKIGKEFAKKMFEGIPNCKQNLFILIDDYKKFKLLKLEPWYNSLDTTNGIWLGTGMENQSVLVTDELSEDDKKYDYAGMAFVIKDGKYTLIKTMMDGDD